MFCQKGVGVGGDFTTKTPPKINGIVEARAPLIYLTV